MAFILGLSYDYHDSAAAIVKNGKVIAAAEEERFSRIKHDSSYPKLAIDFCLKEAGVKSKDLERVVFYEKPFLKFERILSQSINSYPSSRQFFVSSMKEWLTNKLWIKNEISEKLGIPESKISFCDHHMSHAASAFYPSGYKHSAILTLDGVGEWATASWGTGRDNEIKLVKQMKFPNSIGLLYSVFTAFLGFEVNDGEYKVMGMAPYGKPEYLNRVRKLYSLFSDGSIKLDMSYFTFDSSPEQSYNSKFEKLFGNPRDPKSLFFTKVTGYPKFWGKKPSDYSKQCGINQHYANIAASIQVATEEIILAMCKFIAKETGETNLSLAGGVALNSVANGKIVRETPLTNLFIQPAASDSGGALGAALWWWHKENPSSPRYAMKNAYLGKSYKKEVEQFIKSEKIPATRIHDENKMAKQVARLLSQGKVVSVYEGRFEWGPRALGHRSILADPRSQDMKDVVNSKIKFREPYRPFAPVVIKEKAQEYFEIDDPGSSPAKYMIIVIPAKPKAVKSIPAVVHEGTSRLQTVTKQENGRYYKIVSEFGKLTGIPVLMNTSFNLRGEPIVASPTDAFRTFSRSGIDVLVLEDYIILKKDIPEGILERFR